MRLKNIILWDMKFQLKYGFYFIYGVMTVLYLLLLFALPSHWREKAATLMIFSDPAAMGLFFMGAIILLEKSQRVLNAIAVSPVKIWEYIAGKVVSIGLISILVALALAIAADIRHIPLVLLGTGLCSILFTLLGLLASTKIESLNQFLIITIPIELICFTPAVLYLFGIVPAGFELYPFSFCIVLIMGNTEHILAGILLLLLLMAALIWFVYRSLTKMFQSLGGVKL